MKTSTGRRVAFVSLLAFGVLALAGAGRVPGRVPEEPALSVEQLLDQVEKLREAIARGRERIARGEVETVMIRVPFRGNELISMEQAEMLADTLEDQARALAVKGRKQHEQTTAEIQRLVRGIKAIEVPPPVPPTEASITFGRLPEDETTARILLGVDMGVASLDMAGKIGGKVMPPLKLILAAGKTFIAAENGADVYLTKKNETYELALRYLKNVQTAPQFTALVRAMKENRPIPETAPSAMVRAARAILDPQLGSSGTRIAWHAMLSKEARNALLTQATLEAYGWIIGDITQKTAGRILVQRSPQYRQAAEFLDFAAECQQKKLTPTMAASLKDGIDQANKIIEHAFTTYSVAAKGVSEANAFYRTGQLKSKLDERARAETGDRRQGSLEPK